MGILKPFRCQFALLFLIVATAARSLSQQISSATDVVPPVQPLAALPFPLQDVRLLPGPFRDAMARDGDYILSLDPDRLLYCFRTNYRRPTGNAVPYGGWEAPAVELRGHTMGHYLSAASLMYASTGDPRFKARVDYLVAELAKCQAAAPDGGYRAGYLSAFPESFIDRVATNGPVWAPWYTLHKIMAGLLDAYQVAGNVQALTVLTNEANWVRARLALLTTSQIQAMLNTEFGGMNEVLANVYAVTGNLDYLMAARAFDQKAVFGPLAARRDELDPVHVNTQIPKIIGAAREYEMTGVPDYLTIAGFFWERVTQYRSFGIGIPGEHEFFFPTNTFSQHLGPTTAETCNAYNLEKLSRYLFAMNPDSRIMDYYERTLFNSVLASQDTNEGMFTYFLSLKPGHFKTYSTPNDSFWCCVGTGMENHAKYGDTIYFHGSNSLYVNLLIASRLTWPEQGLVVRQDTAFPEANTSVLSFSCEHPVELAVKIRRPAWAQAGMTVSVNGTPEPVRRTADGYLTLQRTWRTADQVVIRCPLTLRLEPLPGGDSNIVALFYGPILLAGDLGTYEMPRSEYTVGPADLAGMADIPAPVMVCDASGFISHTAPVAGRSLTFRTDGIGSPYDVTLIPFYQMQPQRYTVYWQLRSSEQMRQTWAELAQHDALDVDVVGLGDEASESAHKLQHTNSSTGVFGGRAWRHAADGWFSYVLSVQSNEPMTLGCTWWGSDTGNRVFDILVNDRVIRSETLAGNHPGTFFETRYLIPTDLTAGQTTVTVKFQAHAGATAGGLFGLRMMRTVDPGGLESITLNSAPSLASAGHAARQYAQVTAHYQNLRNHPITNSANLVLRSSDPAVLTTGTNAEIIAVGPGVATVTAYYLGLSASQPVTVTPVNFSPAVLRHRYRLNSANLMLGTKIIDSANPGNRAFDATLRGAAAVDREHLVLDGSPGNYLELPTGIIASGRGVTVEAWASFGTEPAWAYLFAFGDTVAGMGQNGFWFTPHSGSGDHRLILSDTPGQTNEYRVTAPGSLDGLSNQHVVAVIDLDNGNYEALYLNGQLVGENSDPPFGQAAIHDVHSYIGKSAYAADRTMVGTVSEVRIYDGRMTAAQAAASYARGPNDVLPEVRPGR